MSAFVTLPVSPAFDSTTASVVLAKPSKPSKSKGVPLSGEAALVLFGLVVLVVVGFVLYKRHQSRKG